MPRLFVIAAVSLMCAAVLGLLVACGGGDEETVEEPTPVPSPEFNPATPLVEFHSADKGYSLLYPEDWEVQDTAGMIGTDMFVWEINGRRVALLQFTCNPDLRTPEELMRADNDVAAEFGGLYDMDAAEPIVAGGLEGTRNTYFVSVAGVVVEHVVVYLPGETCGRRIGLSSFGVGSREQFLDLFDQIIDSLELS